MSNTDVARKAIRKRKEQLDFDALPTKRQKDLRESGLDPYESDSVRKVKQDNVRAYVARMIDKLPEKDQQMLIRHGCHPYKNKDKVIYG